MSVFLFSFVSGSATRVLSVKWAADCCWVSRSELQPKRVASRGDGGGGRGVYFLALQRLLGQNRRISTRSCTPWLIHSSGCRTNIRCVRVEIQFHVQTNFASFLAVFSAR